VCPGVECGARLMLGCVDATMAGPCDLMVRQVSKSRRVEVERHDDGRARGPHGVKIPSNIHRSFTDPSRTWATSCQNPVQTTSSANRHHLKSAEFRHSLNGVIPLCLRLGGILTKYHRRSGSAWSEQHTTDGIWTKPPTKGRTKSRDLPHSVDLSGLDGRGRRYGGRVLRLR